MKKLHIFILMILVLSACSGNSQSKLKRYGVKSGMVQYKITTSGNVMGGTISGSGTSSLYFKDWGAVELKEEKSTKTTSMKLFGRSKVDKQSTHTMDKLDNGKSYSVDFNEKVIYVKNDPMMEMMKESGTDAGEAGKKMLESMGGKKIGNEKYMGYDCEVWSIPGGKEWIYKGVVLKVDVQMMGVRTLEEATDVKFDVSVPDSKFELPDFPIKKLDEMMGGQNFDNGMSGEDNVDAATKAEYLKKMQNMSFEEWKKMIIEEDPAMKNMSDEELRQQYDMMQQMLKMASPE